MSVTFLRWGCIVAIGLVFTPAADGHWDLDVFSGSFPRAFAGEAPPALVVGESAYAHAPALSVCHQAADEVASRLRQQGYDVTELIDATGTSLRIAIDSFAVRAEHAIAGGATIYICGSVDAIGSRLFLLPVDAEIRRPAELSTQALLVKAFVKAIASVDGVLVAEFGLKPHSDAAIALRQLGQVLPPGLHVAIVGSANGVLVLASAEPAQDSWQDWAAFLGAARTRLAEVGGDVTVVFQPIVPEPQPQIADVPVTESVPVNANLPVHANAPVTAEEAEVVPEIQTG